MQHQLGGFAGEDHTVTKSSSAIDLVGEKNGLQGGGQIRNDTSHTEVESLLGNVAQAESVLDDFLYYPFALSFVHQLSVKGNTYRLGPHTSHHINIAVILIRELAM